MKKAELNKDNRIKRSENHHVMESISNTISAKIKKEYEEEVSAYHEENEKYYKDEKEFFIHVNEVLKKVIPKETKVKVITQVGPGSTILDQYVGTIEKLDKYGYVKWFNFISEDRDNDMKPFTIGLSCLQSIEILD